MINKLLTNNADINYNDGLAALQAAIELHIHQILTYV